MDQALRRAFTLSSLAVVIGCSSDASKQADEIAEDAAAAAMSGKTDRAADGGRDASAAGAEPCADLECQAPATCTEHEGNARCSCPSGYEDPNGDGSACQDKDECASDADNDCGRHATCENKPGGFECTCQSPAYQGDGKTCSCADGYTDKQGFCAAHDGKTCSDDLDCVNGNCESGICCAIACNTPAECKLAMGATCSDGKTCAYPTAADGSACDDGNACLTGSTCQSGSCVSATHAVDCNDGNACTDDSCDTTLGCRNQNNTASCDDGDLCTLNDVCAAGVCSSTTLRDCSAQADVCNSGACDPATGNCGKTPVADGAPCDDANSCTQLDRCSSGSCTGTGSACGPNASSCAPGTPNDCTCNASYFEAAGLCVPENNECDANPCAANATCFDPSNAAGDVTCACNAGFEGTGATACTASMPCAGNPCGEGRGTCTPGAAGTYSCSCAAGFAPVGDTCQCDMRGTFAVLTTSALSWSDIAGIEDGAGESSSWSIVRYDYTDAGTLEMESIGCGDTETDLCGAGGAILGREAYAQYADINVAGSAAVPVTRVEIDLSKALPGEPFVTPQFATLYGISLTDPLGTWPTHRRQVQGGPEFSGTAINGARWLDADNDGFIGITTYAVGPDGVTASTTRPSPLKDYGSTSPVCPRSSPSAARYPYRYPPAADGLAIRRIKRFYSANRVIAAYRGTLDSCDVVTGSVFGPSQSGVVLEGVIGGCIRDNNGGDAECSGAVIDFLSGSGEQSQDAAAGGFKMQRAPDTITCAEVRALDFD